MKKRFHDNIQIYKSRNLECASKILVDIITQNDCWI